MSGATRRDSAEDAWESIDDEIDLGATQSVANKVDLRTRTKTRPGKSKDDFDPVAAAEAAMTRLSPSFGIWMENKAGILLDAQAELDKHGISAKTVDAVFRAAHEIKGEAATYGYPLAGDVAASLCRLVEIAPGPNFIPPILITQHVQAIRAIVSERARDEGNSTARKLATKLKDVTDEYVARFE